MSQFDLLPDLIKHFRLYATHAGFNLEEFEIEEVLVPWLEKIQSPTTMRGLGCVLNSLNNWSQEAQVKERLEQIFGLPNWFLPALAFRVSLIDPKREADFMGLKMGSGWCEENPFYAWLFRTHQYNKHPKARAVQLLFIEHYFKTIVDLIDPELSTNSKTREQEVCSAARLVFDAKNMDFNGLLSILTQEDFSFPNKLAQQIERYYKDEDTNLEQKNSNYMRSLVHFLLGNWTGGRHRNRSHRFNKMIARRYNRTHKSAIQGNDSSLQDILPSLPDELNADGVEQDDFYPQQIFIEMNGDFASPRDPKEVALVERVFDTTLVRKRCIDVTNKVRRGQNVSLQNTELLKAGDLARLIHFLQRSVLGKFQAMALTFWAMLLTGKQPAELEHLNVFDDLKNISSGLYLDPEGNGWWSFPVTYSAKPRLGDDDRGLIATHNHVFTACPSFFVQLLRKYYKGGCGHLLPVTYTKKKLAKRLKKFSDDLPSGSRVSLEKIYSFIDRFCFVTGTIDPVVLDFSYQLALSRTRVSRSYACIDETLRVGSLKKLWVEITQYAHSADPSIEYPVFFEERHWHQPQQLGSTFTPSQDACRELVSHLRDSLTALAPAVTFPLAEVIRYHNVYAAYTAYLLMFATGYRAVHNPLPSLALHLRDYRLLGISDKDDSDFTHARVVCMPEILESQLGYYTEHLHMLAELLRCREPGLAGTVDRLLKGDEQLLSLGFSDATQWYQTVRNSRRELGPLFHFKPVYRQWQAVNLFPKALSGFLPDHLSLPTNAGRHWLKSQLIQRRVDPELIDWQMGHWMTGQAPLGYYSSLSHIEVSKALTPILDEVLKEVGWQPLPSKIT